MNIFILDYDIKKSAQYHCDQHVNKMILEAAQMVCTVTSQYKIPTPYKSTHPKHPCTLWAASSLENLLYLREYAFELNEEAKKRYQRKTDHKSWTVIQNLKIPNMPSRGLLPFAKAMPIEYKMIPDYVLAYREYYKTKGFATWKTSIPEWYS